MPDCQLFADIKTTNQKSGSKLY